MVQEFVLGLDCLPIIFINQGAERVPYKSKLEEAGVKYALELTPGAKGREKHSAPPPCKATVMPLFQEGKTEA